MIGGLCSGLCNLNNPRAVCLHAMPLDIFDVASTLFDVLTTLELYRWLIPLTVAVFGLVGLILGWSPTWVFGLLLGLGAIVFVKVVVSDRDP